MSEHPQQRPQYPTPDELAEFDAFMASDVPLVLDPNQPAPVAPQPTTGTAADEQQASPQ